VCDVCVNGERTFAVGWGGAFIPDLPPPYKYSLSPTDVKPWPDLAVGRCPLVAESSVQVMLPGSKEYRSSSVIQSVKGVSSRDGCDWTGAAVSDVSHGRGRRASDATMGTTLGSECCGCGPCGCGQGRIGGSATLPGRPGIRRDGLDKALLPAADLTLATPRRAQLRIERERARRAAMRPGSACGPGIGVE
jgi:hypothetical protein